MQAISENPDGVINQIFRRSKALIGMIHCPPFPGSPRYRGESLNQIYDACLRDAEFLVNNGLHGLIVENHGDVPFSKPDDIGPETPAFMAVVVERIKRNFDVPIGINVLANAPITAFAIARATDSAFIRVNQWANAYIANEGFMEGRAAQAMRFRSAPRGEGIKVFADSHVKHGSHSITSDRSIGELTRDLDFFDVDAVIATGHRTGDSATLEEIEEVADATSLPVLVGSGVDADNIAQILTRASAVIVASSLKKDGVWWNPVDPEKVRSFVTAATPALET